MEDLSSYRRRIGLFASIAHRKHFSRRKVQHPQKSKSSTKRKKQSTKSPSEKHICSRNEHKQQKQPCRLAFLVLLIIISVTSLREKQINLKPNQYDNISLMNTKIYFMPNIESHCLRDHKSIILPETKILFESEVDKEDWDYNSLLTPHMDTNTTGYNGDKMSYVNRIPYQKGSIFDVFSFNISPKAVGKVEFCAGNRCFKSNITDQGFVYISILFLLGTCCYLLGNKGVHCYNGNPPKKSGDAVFTEKALSLIKQHVDESVGFISLKSNLPYGINVNTPLTVSGTGFRAGDKYFITAYHVFRDKIEQMLLDVCIALEDKNPEPVYRQLARKLRITEEKPQISAEDIPKIIKRFVKETGTNIPLLLDTLKMVIDIETMDRGLSEKWMEKCVVNFIKHGNLYVDWKIAFGDEDIDIVIVKLVETKPGQTLPRPLLLDENFRQLTEINIVRYINGETPAVIIDQDTEVFEDDNDLCEQVRAAVKMWEEKFSGESENYFTDAYASCRKYYDSETGRVVFKASKSFQHGASGSPIVYLFNKEGPPVVVMIYQRGLPEFYYDAQTKHCDGGFKDAQIDLSKCLFEGGTTMKKLSEVMTRTGQLDLKSNVFSPAVTLKTDTATGEDSRPRRNAHPHINELNSMIEKSRQQLMETTDYVKTEATDRALIILENSNIIVITGKPGDGKTALSHYLMHMLSDGTTRKRSKSPLIIPDTSLYNGLVRPNNGLCVLVDDIFGKCGVETPKLTSWNGCLGSVLSTFQQGNDSQNNVLILSSRNDILNDCPTSIRQSPVFSEQNMLDLSLKEFMTRKTMTALFQKYAHPLETPLTDRELDKIQNCSPGIGFPQCCVLAKDTNNICSIRTDILTKPYEFLLNELKQLEELLKSEGNLKYYSLLVLLLNPTYFCPGMRNEKQTSGLFTCLKKIYGRKRPGSSQLQDTLHAMTDLYVKYDKKTKMFSFSHEAVYTSVVYSFCSYDEHKVYLVQFCDSKLLSRIVFENEKLLQYEVIELPQTMMPLLINKILEQLQTRDQSAFKYIADAQVWMNAIFVRNMLQRSDCPLSLSHTDLSGRSMLVYFAERSKTALVKKLIDISRVDENYITQIKLATNTACSVGNEELVTYLLRKHATPDIYYFINAIKGRNPEILKVLFKAFPSLGLKKATARFYSFDLPTSITILHQACFEGNIDMVKLICTHLKNLAFEPDGRGVSVLHTACMEGCLEVVEYLLMQYPELLNNDCHGYLPIHEVTISGNIDCYNLVESHIKAESPDIHQYIKTAITGNGYTIFHTACLSGKKEMCLHILKKYPYLINIKDTANPLLCLAWSGDVDCFQIIGNICINESNKNIRDQENYVMESLISTQQDRKTILHEACTMGQEDMCCYIIDNYPNLIEKRDINGTHIIHSTAKSGSINCLKMIIERVFKTNNLDEINSYMMRCLTDGGDTILHIACENEKTQLCQYIVDAYPELLNVKRNDGWHVLHAAASSGSKDCFTFIANKVLENKDPDQRRKYINQCVTNDGSTILHMACSNGKTQFCQFIVDAYPELLNVKQNDGWHVLHAAVSSGSKDCFTYIANKVLENTDPDQRRKCINQCVTDDGRTILHIACLMGKIQLCQYIVDTYPELLNVKQNNEFHVLHAAASSGSKDCFTFIANKVLENKDPDQRRKYINQCVTNDGSTILYIACQNGKTKLCQYIVDAYPELLNVKRNDGWHVLHAAVWSGSKDCFTFISNKVLENTDPDQRRKFINQCVTNDGSTILHIACLMGNIQLCQYIVDAYPELLNVKQNDGRHVLHAAAWSGNKDCFTFIANKVSENKDPDQRRKYISQCVTGDGKTILHIACRNGKTQLCQYIVDAYPDLLNVKENDGWHVLHAAAWSGSKDCFTFIANKVLENKDPDQRRKYINQCVTNDGGTILYIACLMGKTKLCQYIVDAYPELLNVKQNDGWHVLHAAVSSGSKDCFIFIVNTELGNKDPDQRRKYISQCVTDSGSTILHIACLKGKTQLCHYIVDAYPELLNVKRNDGGHVLHEAVWSGSKDCFIFIASKVLESTDPDQRRQYINQCVTNDGSTILHIACQNGKMQLCQYIVDTYPELLKIKSNVGLHVLHSTAISGSKDCFIFIANKVLENKDPDQRRKYINQCVTDDGSTILHIACENGKTQLCQYIVDAYPELLNVKENYGWHVLHAAAWSDSKDCFTFMANKVLGNKDPDQRRKYINQCLTNDGSTILHMACTNGKTQLCQYIVDAYPKLLNVKQNDGWHVLHAAVLSGSKDCFTFIASKVLENTDPDQRRKYINQCVTNDGSTILCIACLKGKTKLCQYIVDAYPELLNVKRNDGWHVLHAAVSSGSKDCFTFISNKVLENTDPDQRRKFINQCVTNDGSTILHIACLMGNIQLCQYIVDAYPELLNVKQKDGRHVLHAAAWSGNKDSFTFIANTELGNKDSDQRRKYISQCVTGDGETILHIACRNGKTQLCQYIVGEYPELLNIKSNDGWHVLHAAAWSGSKDCFTFIANTELGNKDPDQRRKYISQCVPDSGSTILHIACQNGKTELCQYIVDTYPELLKVKQNNGWHVLHAAAMSGSKDCFTFIANTELGNKDPDQRRKYINQCVTDDGSTILHMACSNGKTQLCQYIVDAYPKLLNVKQNDGWHVLHAVASSGSKDCFTFIASKVLENKDPDQRRKCIHQCLTNDGSTILYIACLKGKTKLCQYIVDAYPDLLNVKQNHGCHVLHAAVSSGSKDCFTFIANKVVENTDPDQRRKCIHQCLTNDGSTILFIACLKGKTKLCQYIVDAYPELLNVKQNYGWHVLHAAAWSGSKDCFIFISNKVLESTDPDQRRKYINQCVTNDGRTILFIACQNGKTKLCQYIVDAYPELLNVKRNDGWHVLHAAVWSGSKDCFTFISNKVLENKDPDQRRKYINECVTNDGSTILYIACEEGKTEIFHYLVDKYPRLLQRKNNMGIDVPFLLYVRTKLRFKDILKHIIS